MEKIRILAKNHTITKLIMELMSTFKIETGCQDKNDNLLVYLNNFNVKNDTYPIMMCETQHRCMQSHQ